MTFTPNENLSYDTEYTIRISDAAKDLDGYPLDKNYTWTFTTEYEPEVDVPENGDEEDLTMVYVGVVVVVIVVILLIVVFMVLSKKKKREEEAKKKKEEEEAKKASLKPKLEFIVSDQKTSAMVCPECGASIPEADRCKYCGWHRHM
jgi:Na+-transporting methylmalonyl-CoA/oxaloacetate decarboxylase gamma subunit